jgi:hypothetical protein
VNCVVVFVFSDVYIVVLALPSSALCCFFVFLMILFTYSQLLSLDKEELRESMMSRVMQTAKGGSKGTLIKYVNKMNM